MHEFLTTREVAELLRIKERKVYDLAASGTLPCTKAIGKLLFPSDQIHAWLAEHAEYYQVPENPRPCTLLGSHDPLLEWSIRQSRCGMATHLDGSRDGLRRFISREGIVAGLHIYTPEKENWNVDAVKPFVAGVSAVLITWAYRQRGLIINKKLAPKVKSLADLQPYSFVPRPAEAGAQSVLLHLLKSNDISFDSLKKIKPVHSEDDVGVAVVSGRADVGFGLASVASTHQLHFVPVIEERFDLLMQRQDYFEEPFQQLLRFAKSAEFTDYAQHLQGYRIDSLGSVAHNYI